jgi:chromosome partitioning protein
VNTTKEEKALEDKCKVIAIANQKGGVGKTTTAVNLGVALGFSGKRVLLIDTDPQGSLTKSCKIDNADADALDVTLSELMANEMTGEDKDYSLINKAIKQFENIDLIPANISLSGTETALFNCMSRESVLKRTIEPLKQKYDYILIDCMPSLGMMTINALVAADSVIIPCEPSFLSVKGLDLLLHSIAKVKRQIIDGVLMTIQMLKIIHKLWTIPASLKIVHRLWTILNSWFSASRGDIIEPLLINAKTIQPKLYSLLKRQ